MASVDTATLHARPALARQDTDQILSYYQSEHAGREYDFHPGDRVSTPSLVGRRISSGSNTPSEYSSDSELPASPPSSDNKDVKQQEAPVPASPHRRRLSAPSEGGADRRRLAIVELDSTASLSLSKKRSGLISDSEQDPFPPVPPSGLLIRRGLHINGLALVAPADASSKVYADTDWTPPPSAPILGSQGDITTATATHHRSASETTNYGYRRLAHKSSRDVGIVGTGKMYAIPERGPVETIRSHDPNELLTPIFQTPSKSRSPSPGMLTPELSDSATSNGDRSYSILTPAVGAQGELPDVGIEKGDGKLVDGNRTMGADLEDVMRKRTAQTTKSTPPPFFNSPLPPLPPTSPSPYAQYEPGVHSTAGPLPPPPKFTFEHHNPLVPPPRPPRLRTPMSAPQPSPRKDLEALKESLALPPNVATVLASRSNSRTDSSSVHSSDISPASPPQQVDASISESEVEGALSKSSHKREGAFPPSTSSAISEPVNDPSPVMQKDHLPQADSPNEQSVKDVHVPSDPVEAVPVIEKVPSKEIRHESSWMSLRQRAHRNSSDGSPKPSHQRSPSITPLIGVTSPSPPPKPLKNEGPSGSSNPFKTTLTHLNKRFSVLPKAPSYPSSLPTTTYTAQRSSRTPSPLMKPARRPPWSRMRSCWPKALQYADVLSSRNTVERCKGYANRINELAMYECGLSEWIETTRKRGGVTRLSQTPTGSQNLHTISSSMPPPSQPRHASHGSTASEVTFPTRPDAYTATDLSIRPIDDLASTTSPPPSLPYPSLASAPRSSSTVGFIPPSAQRYQMPVSTSKSSGGFFSSIGRKASMKKGGFSPPTPTKVLMKRSPNVSADGAIQSPRQVHPPSIPGGPRAAPGRMHRAKTISVTPPPQPPAPKPAPDPSPARHSTQRLSSGRRPSIFSRSTSAAPQPPRIPDFEQQVNKLQDLLPHADRNILAGYLQRTGQDILAIGQYIEDEKNGTLRRD